MKLSILLETSTRDPALLNKWLIERGCPPYAEIFKKFGEKYGVRWDVTIFQACLETGFWKFGNDVKREQNNFFGTGAKGGGDPGDSFLTPEEGIEAHMQNMALRAGKKIPLDQIISPYVRKNYTFISNRGTAFWEELAGTYATDSEYWNKIEKIMVSFDEWGAKQSSIPVILTPVVGIDPGHSEKHPGARGKNSSVQEEDLNRFQAKLFADFLWERGIASEIIDPLDDDLWEIGSQAGKYAAFVSLHLNAFKQREYYGCTMCHPRFQKPTDLSARVASEWAIAVSEAVGTPVFSGSAGWPRGVMAVGLTVLNAAAQTGCPIFFLSEAEFVDDETSVEPIKKRLELGMKAGAAVLAKFLLPA